jgi:hypothetical protein
MRKIKRISILYDKLFELKGLDRRYLFRTDPDDYHYTFVDPLPSDKMMARPIDELMGNPLIRDDINLKSVILNRIYTRDKPEARVFLVTCHYWTW